MGRRILLAVSLLAVVTAALMIHLAPVPADSNRLATPPPGAAVIVGEDNNAHQAGAREDIPTIPDTMSAAYGGPGPPTTEMAAPREPQLDLDYAAQVRGEDLPPALLNLMQAAFVEFTRGNIDYAAMLAQDALDISDTNPAVKPMLYGMIGYSYENLGYNDMAIEQYRMALALYPLHRTSYQGMRRLSAEFAATHPELPHPPGQ